MYENHQITTCFDDLDRFMSSSVMLSCCLLFCCWFFSAFWEMKLLLGLFFFCNFDIYLTCCVITMFENSNLVDLCVFFSAILWFEALSTNVTLVWIFLTTAVWHMCCQWAERLVAQITRWTLEEIRSHYITVSCDDSLCHVEK